MYERFLTDPNSVDPAWHDFFADYKPTQRGAADAATDAGKRSSSAAGDSTASKASANGAVVAAGSKPSTASPRPRSSGSGGASAPKSAQAAPAPAAKGTSGATAPSKASAPDRTAGAPAQPGGKAAAKPSPQQASSAAPTQAKTSQGEESTVLRGAAAAIAKNMDASLALPTATSVRAVPAKLMADNRIVINNHLKRTRGGKVSFTHLIGYALIRALADYPNMNRHYSIGEKGKPVSVTPEHVNLGLAIDLPGKDGARMLVVVSIKGCEDMTFTQFWQSYEDVVRKARNNQLTADDFAGTTIALTNPGGIGTNHSVPRLSVGQGAIIGVGAMEYPAHFQGTSEKALVELGVSKIMTLTSTYDHRIIQGAESGEFLKRVHGLLLGEDSFYDNIFTSLRLPYEPVRWVTDIPEGSVDRTARVIELIDAYRTRGHLMADIDPLNYRQRRHDDLDVLQHGLTLWDLDREFAVGGFSGEERMKLRDILGVLRNSYCRTVGVEYMHILEPSERRWLQERIEVRHEKPATAVQKYILSKLNAAEAFETFLQTKYVGQKRFSLEGGETVIALLDAVLDSAAEYTYDEVVIGMAHRGRLNVLANVVGKPISQIFREFEGNLDPG
ncbi:MAG: multifunctional oxoglutarate decarboxylase/oxoglutarate dehydrogenase thiamine pyrophosphate-binding subunit/dihydrolipoyllysine-residue succinyltransferase subunit, partial [Sciscionella sp.]